MHWTEYLPPLIQGAWVTIQLTIYSTILGAVLAFAFGIGKMSSNWAIKAVSVAYIEVFRGTSLLVQLFWLYFALPLAGMAIGVDLRLPPVVAGVLALGLNIGAYGAEVVRGADLLDTTPRQLWLYDRLGLTPPARFAHVPLMLGEDGARLAKRHGAITVEERLDAGATVPELVGEVAASVGLIPAAEPIAAADLVPGFDLGRIPAAPSA